MSLSPTQESQVIQLLAKQAELLSLADNQVEIISELGAGSEAMPDLAVATTIDDADLLLVRQGTTDKSVAASVLKAAVGVADNSITQAKMADNSVGTAEIIDANVTDAKIAAMSASKLTGDVAAARITSALNATGSAPIFACRAWVNFNGTGTVAIRASGNVSSITDNGTGDYTVNFTTSMPDANYGVVATAYFTGGYTAVVTTSSLSSPVNSSCRVSSRQSTSAAAVDSEYLSVSIFR